jgi:uncharacterized protein (TIGR02117 family)
MYETSKYFITTVLFILNAVHSGCAGPLESLYPPKANEPSISVYVVNHNDWHTGIVIRRQDIPAHLWPENHHFKDSEYLEVGWGDRDYYMTPEPTLWMTLKAALWPTESVLHIVGFTGTVEAYFPASEIVEIKLSRRGFERLNTFIQDEYARDASGAVTDLGPGLYGNSRFYLGREKFHLLRTCNVWIARTIRSTGFPITPFYAITASNVIYQTSKYGRMIRSE